MIIIVIIIGVVVIIIKLYYNYYKLWITWLVTGDIAQFCSSSTQRHGHALCQLPQWRVLEGKAFILKCDQYFIITQVTMHYNNTTVQQQQQLSNNKNAPPPPNHHHHHHYTPPTITGDCNCFTPKEHDFMQYHNITVSTFHHTIKTLHTLQ